MRALPAFLALTLAVSACGSTGQQPAPVASGPAPALRSELAAPGDYPLVAIRYPSVMDPQVAVFLRGQYDLAFASTSDWTRTGGPCREIRRCRPDPEDFRTDVLPLALIKTSYHVHEFRARLKRLLPERSIVLQPQRLTMRGGRAVLDDARPPPPAAVVVDFFVWVSGRTPGGDAPDTFGNRITPYITVRTSRAAAPVTRGALAGMDAFGTNLASPDGADASGDGDGLTVIDIFNRQRWLERVDIEKEKAAREVRPSRGPRRGESYFVVPTITFESDAHAITAHPTDAAADPGETPFAAAMDSMAHVVVEALNAVDADKARTPRAAAALHAIDPGLPGSPDPSDPAMAARLALANRCIGLETQFLWELDEEAAAEMYGGDFGKSMRGAQLAEITLASDLGATPSLALLDASFTRLANGGEDRRFSGSFGADGVAIHATSLANLRSRCTERYKQAVAGLAVQTAAVTPSPITSPVTEPLPSAPAPPPAPEAPPAPQTAPVPDAAPAMTQTAELAPPPITSPITEPLPREDATPASGRDFALHLSSLRSEDEALVEWDRLRGRARATLQDLLPTLRTVDLGEKGVFVRLLAGSFQDRVAANAVCAGLKEQGLYCAVMRP